MDLYERLCEKAEGSFQVFPTTGFRWRQIAISLTLQLVLIVLLYSPPSFGAENTRITFILNEVPTSEKVEAQIRVSWGARTREVPASWLHHHNRQFTAPRKTGTLKFVSDTKEIDSAAKSFIVYGRVLATDTNKTIAVIPAKLYDTNQFKSLNQITVEITPRRSFDDAFRESYPLEFRNDTGYLNTENVRPTLRSFRLMMDYAGETTSQISEDSYKRVHSFFQGNRHFFRKGGSLELSEALGYLKTYAAASRNPVVTSFYAEFLNGLIGLVTGTEVFDEDITDYLHGQLMQLYESKLPDAFEQADISMRKFQEMGRNKECLALSEKVLRALDEKTLDELMQRSPNNVYSILLQTTICGQYHYEKDSGENGANHRARTKGANFLARSEIGRPAIIQYKRICEHMVAKKWLPIPSAGQAAEIAKYYIDYYQALGGVK